MTSATGERLIFRIAAALAVSCAYVPFAGAQAEEPLPDVEIEIPVLVLDVAGDDASSADEELDLANVVQSAAKGVTTVQEAPAIVTVMTGEDITERGYDNLQDALDTVPGWLRTDSLNNLFAFPLVRGQLQAMLYMHNGMSLFDPWGNVPTVGRALPIEMVKRIEVVTGPGGVLWGANSFLGVVNIITKDAEDIDGVEANALVGHGDGDRTRARAYVMAGVPEIAGQDLSLFLHVNVETYQGPKFQNPQQLFSTPSPQPNSLFRYGGMEYSDQQRSYLLHLNAKLGLGPVDIYGSLPFTDMHTGLSFPGNVIQRDKPEDFLRDPDGMLLCTPVSLRLEDGSRNPAAYQVDDPCFDRARTARDNAQNFIDRYVMAEYKTRFADGQAGATLRAYGTQFKRDYTRLTLLDGTSLLEGGLSFQFQIMAYRVGGVLDGDVELPGNLRLLYGGEVFREWTTDETTASRQGAGSQTTFFSPNDLDKLPLLCPREPDPSVPGAVRFVEDCPLTLQFETNRSVAAAYVNPQFKPSRKLTLDGGVRVQAAGGGRSYPTQLIFSAAAVYQLARNWHTKLNYAQGFRSPWFLTTDSNGEAVQVDGSRDVEVERSQALQGEVNARLFKGDRRLREISLRADYSYTKLENLLQIIANRYQNTGDRGIHSAEFLGKIFLQGDHRFELGYTWLSVATDDSGMFRTVPEHWFNVGGVFTLVPETLQLATTLRVYGAFEDPNRIVEYRDVVRDPDGIVSAESQKTVQPHEVVLDRIPSAAELAVGVTYLPSERWQFRGFVHNAFNTRHFQADGFSVYEPRLEILPNPYPDIRFTLSGTYSY